jgi:hypothetical protein
MQIDRTGLVILLLSEVGLGAWTLFHVLESHNLLDLLKLFTLC